MPLHLNLKRLLRARSPAYRRPGQASKSTGQTSTRGLGQCPATREQAPIVIAKTIAAPARPIACKSIRSYPLTQHLFCELYRGNEQALWQTIIKRISTRGPGGQSSASIHRTEPAPRGTAADPGAGGYKPARRAPSGSSMVSAGCSDRKKSKSAKAACSRAITRPCGTTRVTPASGPDRCFRPAFRGRRRRRDQKRFEERIESTSTSTPSEASEIRRAPHSPARR